MRKWRVKYGISKEEDTVHSKGKSREKSRRAGQKIKGGNTQKSQLVSKEHKNERISLAKSAKEKENVNEKLKEKSKQKSQEKSQPKPK